MSNPCTKCDGLQVIVTHLRAELAQADEKICELRTRANHAEGRLEARQMHTPVGAVCRPHVEAEPLTRYEQANLGLLILAALCLVISIPGMLYLLGVI